MKCCFSKIIQDEISQCSCSTVENMYKMKGPAEYSMHLVLKYSLNVRENGANDHMKVGLP